MDHIITPLQPLAVDIESLVPDPENAMRHSDRNIETIKKSLAKYGQRTPLVCQKSNRVIRAGNGTCKAAKALGWKYVAAIFVEEDDFKAAAYAISDNRTGKLAEWNDNYLARVLKDLKEAGEEIIGFTDEECKGFVEGWEATREVDPDQIEDYDPDAETFILKIDGVTEADAPDVEKRVTAIIKDLELPYECRVD